MIPNFLFVLSFSKKKKELMSQAAAPFYISTLSLLEPREKNLASCRQAGRQLKASQVSISHECMNQQRRSKWFLAAMIPLLQASSIAILSDFRRSGLKTQANKSPFKWFVRLLNYQLDLRWADGLYTFPEYMCSKQVWERKPVCVLHRLANIV